MKAQGCCDFSGLVETVRQYVAEKINQTVKNMVQNTIDNVKSEVKDLAHNSSTTVYAKADVGLKSTVGGAADIKGVGVKGDVKSRELVSATIG